MGKPGWVDTDKWDIEAKADTPGEPNFLQLHLMMQKLFAERFGLQVHEETRRMPAFVLSVSKDGPKMTRATDASSAPGQILYPSGVLIGKSLTIAALAKTLEHYVLSKPVVDKTGLDGPWDFTLKWAPDDTQFPDAPESLRHPADDAKAWPPLFTAIQEQLGLKLEAQKSDVRVLVVDHVDRPSPN
jgi:uncharacterized protein (TIGR03435 family)